MHFLCRIQQVFLLPIGALDERRELHKQNGEIAQKVVGDRGIERAGRLVEDKGQRFGYKEDAKGE